MMNQIIITTPEELEQMLARILKSNLPANYLNHQSKDKQILNIDEASQFTGIPKNTIYGYTYRRLIPHKKVGRSLKFLRSELIIWLEEFRQKTKSEIQNDYN